MELRYHIYAKQNKTGEPKIREKGLGSFLYSKSDRKDLILEAKSLIQKWSGYNITIRPVNLGRCLEIGLYLNNPLSHKLNEK